MNNLDSYSSNQRFALSFLIPSLYLIPLVVAYFSPKHFGFGHRFLVYVGLCVGALGMVSWILSVWHLGEAFATLPGAKRLVRRGVYRFVRHPMYLAISSTVFGLMLACGSSFGMIYLAVVILPLNFVRSRFEDQALEKLFGPAFKDYKKSTWF